MKKILKIAAISLAVLLLILAGAFLTLRKMFPPEKVKAMVLAEVSSKLGREAKLGSITVGIFKGIVISDFALSEHPTFKEGTFVSSQRLSLKFPILPLLKKKVIVDEIKLENPEITIVRNSDGRTFNFSSLISSAPAKTAKTGPETPETPSSVSLTVSKASISGGKVEFIDRSPAQIKVSLDPIDISVTGTGLDKPMSVSLSVGVKGTVQKKTLSGKLSAEAVLDLLAQKVEINSLDWTMKGARLSVKGSVQSFIKPKMKLQTDLSGIDLKELSAWVTLPKGVRIPGSPRVKLNIDGTLAELDADLKLSLDGLETGVKGTLKKLDSSMPEANLHVKIAPFDLKAISNFTDAAKDYEPSGNISLEADAKGPLSGPDFKGTLTLDGLHAKVDKMVLDSLSGKISFTKNSVEISGLKGKIGEAGKNGSDFEAKASVKDFKNPDISLDAHLSLLDLNLFIKDKKEAGAPAGEGSKKAEEKPKPYSGPVIRTRGKIVIDRVLYTKFDGENASAAWDLTGFTPPMTRLNGTAVLEMGKGTIHKIPLLASLAPILKTDPSAMAFTRLGGHLTILEGTAETKDFQINSPQADLFASGTIFLPTNLPDMTLTAKLPKGSMGGTVGEFTNDPEGRPTFVFKMKGGWKPAFDSSQIQKKAAEKAKEELKKKAGDFMKNEGQKLLDGLFKR